MFQLCSMTQPQPSYSAFREASFGHVIFDIKNRTHAYYTWHRNQDGSAVVADSMWFTNGYFNPTNILKLLFMMVDSSHIYMVLVVIVDFFFLWPLAFNSVFFFNFSVLFHGIINGFLFFGFIICLFNFLYMLYRTSKSGCFLQ
jgi:Iron/zinc purple acid phosphatase-like protein C